MNRQLLLSIDFSRYENLLQCNKYCVITIPIYPIPKYSSRIKFCISWCKKAIYIQILLSNRLFQFCHD